MMNKMLIFGLVHKESNSSLGCKKKNPETWVLKGIVFFLLPLYGNIITWGSSLVQE